MFFEQVSEAPPDPIFGLLGAFQADPRKEKVNLMVGIYKDDQLKAELLSSVKKVQAKIQNPMADYLPIDGLSELVQGLGPVVFGDGWKEAQGRIYGAHTAGGTGALRVGTEFLAKEVGKTIYIPNHTWPNHRNVIEKGGCKAEIYPYYSQEKRGFDFEKMRAFFLQIPHKSAVVLHACCHNPTGCDPSLEQWKEISKLMKERALLPFFDFAYQGLGSGVEQDAAAVRLFLQEGHQMLIAYSCSKNFSMYCHRTGILFAVNENAGIKTKVGSQIKRIIRALYSNPPAYGAWIVHQVLQQETDQWHKDLAQIRHRLQKAREDLIKRLMAGAKKTDFSYLRHHNGMFSFVDLDKRQVQRLIDEFAIYLTDNGRISVAGLSSENIEYVTRGILTVCGER